MSQSTNAPASPTAEPIEFIDLQAQRRHIGRRMESAIMRSAS